MDRFAAWVAGESGVARPVTGVEVERGQCGLREGAADPVAAFQDEGLSESAEYTHGGVDRGVEAAADDDLPFGAGVGQQALLTVLVRPVGVQRLVGCGAAGRVEGDAGEFGFPRVRELRFSLPDGPQPVGGARRQRDRGEEGLNLRGWLEHGSASFLC
jgi:hypothetical protein